MAVTTATAASRAAHKRQNKKRKKQRHGLRTGLIVTLIAALLLVVGLYAWGSMLESSKTIYPNVRMAGVEIGGLTTGEARTKVETAVAQAYTASTLEVQLPDRTITFSPEQTSVAIDTEEALREALAYGRSDGPFQAILNYLRCQTTQMDIPLETALEFDREAITQEIQEAAVMTREAPQNSAMALDEGAGMLEVTRGREGRELDTEGLYEAVCQAFETGNFEPIVWEYQVLPYEDIDLAALHETLESQIHDAVYNPETHTIEEGVSGYRFDLQAAETRLERAAPGETFTVPLLEAEPAVDAATLSHQMFGTKLESRSSSYVQDAKRTENLRLACEAINGTIVNPGEIFSFNDVVGERTAEKGYQPATIYGGDGASVDDLGGGVCQVASTIYYTTLYMDLEQVQREPHMYTVTYVPAGMDATVFYDSGLDYQFRNNRENPIKIQANIDGGKVNITFWGVKENDNYVVMDSQALSTFTEEPQEKLDETKPVGYRQVIQGAYTGAKVEAYQKVYDGNGNLLESRTIYSTYKARPAIYVVGPTEAPATEDPPVTDPSTGTTPDTPETPPEETIPDDPLGGGEETLWP